MDPSLERGGEQMRSSRQASEALLTSIDGRAGRARRNRRTEQVEAGPLTFGALIQCRVVGGQATVAPKMTRALRFHRDATVRRTLADGGGKQPPSGLDLKAGHRCTKVGGARLTVPPPTGAVSTALTGLGSTEFLRTSPQLDELGRVMSPLKEPAGRQLAMSRPRTPRQRTKVGRPKCGNSIITLDGITGLVFPQAAQTKRRQLHAANSGELSDQTQEVATETSRQDGRPRE